ncbi:MAG: HEAT repeat domain-containing protein [Actinomycetes bacterium]|jgi:HEAT repeat protein|nr:MAG: hypothetical protein DIU67_04555 [Actinomycetota bacterium]
MSLLELVQYATLVVLVLDAVGVGTLIVLKAVNRRRRLATERRKREYMRLISRHVAFEYCTDPIPADAARDPAFIDAIIDFRNVLAGSELANLERLISRHGVVRRLIKDLSSPWKVKRLRAAMALAEIGGDETVDVLLAHLDDREPEIRVQAARGLGRIGWTPAIDEIVSRFGRVSPWVRARFADTLIGFGADATWPLVAYVMVNHRHETAGPVAAIRTLAAIGDAQAVKPLMDVLETATDTEVTIAALDALGSLGHPMAAPVMRTAATNPDWRIRAKVVTALGQVGDVGALEVLATALTDESWWVRRNAAAALGAVPGGLDRLYEAVAGDDRFASDAAMEALVDIGELTAARMRMEGGIAAPRDLALISHVEAHA